VGPAVLVGALLTPLLADGGPGHVDRRGARPLLLGAVLLLAHELAVPADVPVRHLGGDRRLLQGEGEVGDWDVVRHAGTLSQRRRW
jgi:hypothetical protein